MSNTFRQVKPLSTTVQDAREGSLDESPLRYHLKTVTKGHQVKLGFMSMGLLFCVSMVIIYLQSGATVVESARDAGSTAPSDGGTHPGLVHRTEGNCAAINEPMPLHLVSADKAGTSGGVCLDGSPPGYYYTPPALSSTKWVLYFKGGGWCWNEGNCARWAETPLGSSKHFEPTSTLAPFSGLMDSRESVNPSFCSFNRVLLWYCDGASFTGDASSPYVHPKTQQTLWFRGRRVLEVLLDTLRERHGLALATEVLISGESSGGLAAYLHADRIHEYLLKLGAPLIRFKAAPVSGFFLLHSNAAAVAYYPNGMKNVFKMQNSTRGVNQACVAALPSSEQWRCIFANYSYSFSTTPMFPLQSVFDAWQMNNIWKGDLECCKHNFDKCSAASIDNLNDYANDMLRDLERSNKFHQPGEGAFLETCLEHTSAQYAGFRRFINTHRKVTLRDALAAWWLASTGDAAATHQYMPCLLNRDTKSDATHQCNPSCW